MGGALKAQYKMEVMMSKYNSTRCCSVCNRPQQPFATVCRWSDMALTLGEAFGEGFGRKHDVSDSCEIERKRVET